MTSLTIKNEALKIYKYNPLIKGRIIGKLTDFDFLLNETLLKIAQKEMRQSLYCEFQACNFHIHMSQLKEMLYESKAPMTWRRDVKNSLTRLRELTIELRNYEVPDENFLKQENNIMSNNYDIKTTRKIEYTAFGLCEEPEIKDNMLFWRYSKYLVFWAWYKKDYTHLSLPNIRKLKSKYAQRIYEYIEYYTSLNKTRGNITTQIMLDKGDFEEIINIKDSSVAVLFQKIHLDEYVLDELRKIYPKIQINSPKRSNIIKITLE